MYLFSYLASILVQNIEIIVLSPSQLSPGSKSKQQAQVQWTISVCSAYIPVYFLGDESY